MADYPFQVFSAAQGQALLPEAGGLKGELPLDFLVVVFRLPYRMIPIPARTDSITAAAMTDPTWPPALAPMACMSR